MNAEQQIERLQGLLERVQKNAALPRQRAEAQPPAAAAAEQVVAEPEPVEAVAAPEPSIEEAVAEAPNLSVAEAPEDVELFDDEIVDLTAEELEAEEIGVEEIAAEEPAAPEVVVAASAGMGPEDEDIFFEEEEEQFEPPASSRRPKVAESMDEALAGAAELDLEQEREVPLKTPPPESGRQVTGPPPHGLHQPSPPADLRSDVDELLEADISSGMQQAKPTGPTPEQLGQTIDLEESEGEPLELQAPPPTPPPAKPEELEAPLPAQEAHGSYSAGLAPPPEARAELEARRRRETEPAAIPSAPPPPAGEVEPVVVQRPPVVASGPAADFVAAHREFEPQSFVELLDASLSLGE